MGTDASLAEGTVIGGRYTVKSKLGEGGMGTVYLAHQASMNRRIALKTLSFKLRNDPRLVKRFYREARASSALVHPNIVQVYDFGVDDQTSVPYIAMEYLEGIPLDKLVRKEKSLPEARAAYYVAEVARGLTEAHNKGLVHRDLKPDNVMVRTLSDGTEQVKVLDFGIAKIVHDESDMQEAITAIGMAMGTPSFMSPEQARTMPLDYRSDLYCLGCLLHHLLTGRPPFEAQDLVALLMKQVEAPAPALPATLIDGRPPTALLRNIYQRLMAKSPDDRPQSTQEVAELLAQLTNPDKRQSAFRQTLSNPAIEPTKAVPPVATSPTQSSSSNFGGDSPTGAQRAPSSFHTGDGIAFERIMTLDSEEGLDTELVRYGGELGLMHRYDLDDKPDVRGALVSAIRRSKSLTHPRLQPVIGIDRERYVLPIVPGESLAALMNAARIAEREPLPKIAMAHIAFQTAEALAALHDAGHCYGWVTAEHVHVSLEGDVTLMDRPGVAVVQHGESGTEGTPHTDVKAWARLVSKLGRHGDNNALDESLAETAAKARDGVFVDAVSLLEVITTDAKGRSSCRSWLEDTFASRWAAWRRHWGQTNAEEAIADLIWAQVTADPFKVQESTQSFQTQGNNALETRSTITKKSPSYRTRSVPVGNLPADGYNPQIYVDDDEDEDYVPPRLCRASMDEILDPLIETEASGDPNSALVLEVVRIRHETAMASIFLHVGRSFHYGGHRLARMSERGAEIAVPPGSHGWFYRLGEKHELKNGQSIEAGERAEVALDGRIFRFRVDRAAREVGRATGVKKPYRRWAVCAALGIGMHVGFFLFVMSLSSIGIQLTVEQPAEAERFAHLKPPSELPKEKPKPKKTPKKKKAKKKKPKVKTKKVKPRPPDPTEAPPVIPDRLREKLKSRTARRAKGSKTATEALLKQLAAPDPSDAPSVSDIRANIDAIKGSGRSAAFQVAGDLVAGVPGAKIQVAGASGGVVTKGKSGKGVGRLGKRTRGGRTIRGKVKASKVMARVRGSLSKAAVSKAINSRIGRIQRCYEKELMKSGKTISGKVKAEWTVTTKGRVRGAKVKLNTLGNQKVASCVLKEIKKIRFPKPKGGEVVIVYPFIFSSR